MKRVDASETTAVGGLPLEPNRTLREPQALPRCDRAGDRQGHLEIFCYRWQTIPPMLFWRRLNVGIGISPPAFEWRVGIGQL
jgi:hypothetical protein